MFSQISFFSISSRTETNKYTIGHICFIFLVSTPYFIVYDACNDVQNTKEKDAYIKLYDFKSKK